MFTNIKKAARGLLVALVISLSVSAVAAGQATTALTKPTETDKVKSVICLIKAALGDCTKTKLRDWTGMANPNTRYFDDTFGGLCDRLTDMLADGRIKKADLGGGAKFLGKNDRDNDVIIIDKKLLSFMCGGVPSVEGAAKMLLATGLINEMIHHSQILAGDKTGQCEDERDSDLGSIKLVCALLDALSSDANNTMPHTTVAAVGAELKKLQKCLEAAGIVAASPTQAADLAFVHKIVQGVKTELQKRVNCFFNPIIANPADQWEDYYKNGGQRKKMPKKLKKDVARKNVEAGDSSGTATRFYPLPGAEILTQATAYINDQIAMQICMSSWDPSGNLVFRFYPDLDGDQMPEIPVVIPTVQIPYPFGDPGLEGIGLHHSELQLFGGNSSLFVQDYVQGGMLVIPLDPAGLPLGPPQPLYNDPALQAGQFEWLYEVFEVQPGVARFIHSAHLPVGVYEGSPSIWFDIDTLLMSVTPFINPGQTMAEALAPDNAPSIADLTLSNVFRLYGNPGSNLQITSVGKGGTQPLAGASAGPDGLTPLLVAFPPMIGNDLLIIDDGSTQRQEFLPRVGTGVDNTESDENGDGTPDRLDLTTNPARIHFSAGPNGAPSSPERQHLYEMVLEQPSPDNIAIWQPGLRQVIAGDETIDFTLLPGSFPPLYVQTIADLDGDGNQDDGVVLRLQPNFQPVFVLEVIQDVFTAPFPFVQIPLPAGFEPQTYTLTDLDGDLDTDICIPDHFGGPAIVIDNLGLGVFQPVFLPLYPGTGEDFILQTEVNGGGCLNSDVKVAFPGDTVDFRYFSPGGTFNGEQTLMLGQQFFTGFPPISPFAGIAVDPFAVPGVVIIFDAIQLGPLGGNLLPLPPQGFGFQFLVPPGLSGTELMLQSFTLTGPTANGIFGSSDGKTIRFN